jgi:hypothetical protein
MGTCKIKRGMSGWGGGVMEVVPNECFMKYTVIPLKLASANSVESLAIYPFKPTCD